MPNHRVEKILDELTRRYFLSARFLTQVKPMVERILSGDFSPARRTHLLEELAATCERDLALRAARKKLDQGFRRLLGLLPGADPEQGDV